MGEAAVELAGRVESEDRLLLREFTHRTGNDYAMALAAMRLSVARPGKAAPRDLVEQAIGRLEASSAVHLLLAAPVRREADAGAMVRLLCAGLVDADPGSSKSRVVVEAAEMRLDGDVARRVLLVAAELVGNAIRHALNGRRGFLTVRLDRRDGMVRLVVADDGPGIRAGAPPSGTGWGRGIVSELVGRAGGSLSVDTGPAGTVVEVLMPERAGDDEVQHAF